VGVCAALAQEFIKHLAYSRQHFPSPYAELAVQVREELDLRAEFVEQGKARRRTGAMNKLIKSLTNFDRMLEIIGNLFTQVTGPDIPELVILFGGSIFSPKEIYILRFACNQFEGEPPSTQVIQQSSRVLLRTLITKCPALFNTSSLGHGKLFVLARLPLTQDAKGLSLPPQIEFATEASGSTERHAGFRPRPGFKLKLRSANVTCVHVGGDLPLMAQKYPSYPKQLKKRGLLRRKTGVAAEGCENGTMAMETGDDRPQIDALVVEEDEFWIQCEVACGAVRPPKCSSADDATTFF
jgi:hypothetical protein